MSATETLRACLKRCAELDIPPTPLLLIVTVATQTARLFESPFDATPRGRDFRISTSKFGIGQNSGSNQTPLGLHRIAEKIGAGCEPGTVFKGRRVVGHLRDGWPLESITTRILWLEGLEEGFNRGGNVDTHARYIYLHGFGDQASIGTPTSLGCIHFADPDLIELFDLLPSGTLVWIAAE
jgi:hypothetical protein